MSALSAEARATHPALPRVMPLLMVALAAVVLRHFVVANCDVSWDLTVADKMLDGERLYTDIIEVNPPATIYLYMLPAIIGRLSGLPAEFFVDALVFAAAGASLWLSGRILARAKPLGVDRGELATVAAAVLLIIPAHTFGEREHIVLIAFLPVLAVAVLRAEGKRPDFWMMVVAGLGGGVIAIIKPFFAVPIICTAAGSAWCARSWRPVLALENFIAAAMLAAYSAAVAAAFPQFFADVMPLVLAVYVPAKLPLSEMLLRYATPLWLTAWALTALIKRRTIVEPPLLLLLAASAGFALAFYIQQKGWPYQSYPMIGLALIGFVPAFLERWRGDASDTNRHGRMALALLAGLIVGGSFSWMNSSLVVSDLAREVRAIKPHPKILTLSIDLSVGFPLTREVEGTWVGRVASLWVTADVWHQQLAGARDAATLATLKAYAERDRRMFTEDVVRGRPDIILVDHRQQVPWAAWLASYAPLAEAMTAYRKVRTLGEIDILARTEGG